MSPPPRTPVANAGRVVIKLGTRVLTHDDGRLALSRLFTVVEQAARLRRLGRDVLIVSSGAVGLGAEALGMTQRPTELRERQACAAVGQTRLMGLYEAGFSRLGCTCGQLLLTESDLDERARYLHLRRTLETMLSHGVIPIINENDAVSSAELAFLEGAGDRPVFGDNDRLSALVAAKLDAELLVLLTDVDGVYARDPRVDPAAPRLKTLSAAELSDVSATESRSGAGRGGMRSKVDAALVAARAGCHAVIASGRDPDTLARLLDGHDVGTWIPAVGAMSARRRWIAFATAARGALVLDGGAIIALRDRGASLLAAGVCRIDGGFQSGDVVELRSRDGGLIGRGVVCCDAAAARRWANGEPPPETRNHHALVHRDDLVLEPA